MSFLGTMTSFPTKLILYSLRQGLLFMHTQILDPLQAQNCVSLGSSRASPLSQLYNDTQICIVPLCILDPLQAQNSVWLGLNRAPRLSRIYKEIQE
jgi:hypothetical protein